MARRSYETAVVTGAASARAGWTARIARVEKPRGAGAPRSPSDLLTGRCYTEPPVGQPRPASSAIPPTGTPITRFLPWRFDPYIARSAVIMSSSDVCPSCG